MSKHTDEQIGKKASYVRYIGTRDTDPACWEAADMLDEYAAECRQAEQAGWTRGDVDREDGHYMWTAGINIPVSKNESGDGIHSSAIECHASTKEKAEALRDKVMARQAKQATPIGWVIEWDTEEGRVSIANLGPEPSLELYSKGSTKYPIYRHPVCHAALAAAPTPGEDHG